MEDLSERSNETSVLIKRRIFGPAEQLTLLKKNPAAFGYLLNELANQQVSRP
jgi:hypothetical protein